MESFLFRPHSMLALLVLAAALCWSALHIEHNSARSNSLQGLGAALLAFVLIGAVHLPSGPFVRPHPVLWRMLLALSIAYLLLMVFLLFQRVDDARQLAALLDTSLGVSLPERSYAEHCEVTWKNVYDQLDMFIWAHSIGWYAKALILRDHWLLWIISVMFEVMEYSLEHQLPNFAECWWDHWILDVFTCNWLGIWLGMRTCDYLQMKTYDWKAIQDIPTYSGKLRRTMAQFTPMSWTAFDWAASRSFKGYCVVLAVVALFLMDELHLFYLKALLWIPPSHWIIGARTLLHALMGSVSVRETYQYVTDPECKKLGAQAWVMVATILLETLVCVKWSQGMFTAAMPHRVKLFWAIFSSFVFVLFPLWKFVLLPRICGREGKRAVAARTSPKQLSR